MIDDEIYNCKKCELYKTRSNPVIYKGVASPKVLFIGEAPGAQEDKKGEPFVGPAGKILTEKLATLDFDYGITNIVKCRPPGNKFSEKYAEACSGYLVRQIEELNPDILVAVGNSSLHELTGESGITRRIGRSLFAKPKYGMKLVIPLIHPSAVLRSREANKPHWERGWDYLVKILEDANLIREKKDHEQGLNRHIEQTSKGVLYGIDESEFEETDEEQGFVHLHLHSEHSKGDAFGRLKAIVLKAKAMGFKALAITDHGNMAGCWKFFNECISNGIKPIIGMEAYVINHPDDKKSRHAVLLAKNYEGYKQLMYLTFLGEQQFYRRPRVTAEQLCSVGKDGNIVITTACTNSIIYFSKEILSDLVEAFGENFYFEIQPHAWEQQLNHNNLVFELSKEYSRPIIVSNDVHYLTKNGVQVQDIIKKSQPGGKGKPYTVRTLFLMSEKEIRESLIKQISKEKIDEILANTLAIAEEIDIQIPQQKNIIPKPNIPKQYADTAEYLEDLAKKGLKERIPEQDQQYRERLEYELEMIIEKTFSDYFILVYNLLNWCRDRGIELGPGRGSVGGSLVAYCLYIHDVNPIEMELYFERFISPTRTDLPDIDMDFQYDRRHEVIEYLKEEYGEDSVIHLGTWASLTGRSCLKDISRALAIPYDEVNKVTQAIIQRSGGDARVDYTISDSFDQFDICKRFDRKYPQVRKFAEQLEGHLSHYGTHAAGVLVTPTPIYDYSPVMRASKGLVTAYEGSDAEEIGILKLDILGLTTLGILAEAKEMLFEKGIEIDWNRINIEDQKVLEQFSLGNTLGVFQFESLGITKMARSMKIDSFEDLLVLNALHRPGPLHSGLAADFIRTRNGFEEVKKLHPIYDKVLEKTLGFPIYQEQILMVLRQLGSMDWGKVNSIRKIIKHSTGVETFSKQRDVFIQGAQRHDCSEELAREIFDRLIFFGSYGFNKAHAAEYAVVAYRCMYLKTYYPKEFMLALLRAEKVDHKISSYIRELDRLGFIAEMPDVNCSGVDWAILENSFYMGLKSVKSMREKVAKQIVDSAPYTDIYDFARRVRCSKAEWENLARAQAFRTICPNVNWILDNRVSLMSMFDKGVGRGQKTLAQWGVVKDGVGESPWEFYPDITESQKDAFVSSVIPYPVEDTVLERVDEDIKKYFVGISPSKINEIDFEEFENVEVTLRAIIPSVENVNWKIVGMEGGAFADDNVGMEGAKYLHANSIDETDFVLLHFAPEVYNLYKEEWDRKYFELGEKGGFPILVKGRVNPYGNKITKVYVDNFVFMDEFNASINNDMPIQPYAEYLMGKPLWLLASARGKRIGETGELIWIAKSVKTINGKITFEAVSEDNQYFRGFVDPREANKYPDLSFEHGDIFRVSARWPKKKNWKTKVRKIFEKVE